VKRYYRKFCRRRNFLNSQQRKQKLKIKTIPTTNSAKLIKSKRSGASSKDIYFLNLFLLKEALSFPRGVLLYDL